MFGFYCDTCDKVITRAGKLWETPIPTHHYLNGEFHCLTYMGWWHPDFKTCEVEGTILNQIETLGLFSRSDKIYTKGETE